MPGRTQTGRAGRVVAWCAGLVVGALALAAPAAQATLPGDNGRIVFDRGPGGMPGNGINMVNPDGSRLGFVTIAGASIHAPALSPDGAQLVYGNGDGPGREIHRLILATGEFERLTDNTFLDSAPVFNSAGTKIMFSTAREAGIGDDRCCEIFQMNPGGTAPVNLSNTNGIDDAPDVAPDGSAIAFEREGEIWSMNADGSGQTQLTSAGGREPSFSPDGARIAFASDRDPDGGAGNSEIYVMNSDGSAETRLTTSPAVDRAPSFSPDGTKIAFASGSTIDGGDLYVMNADGANVTPLVTGPDFTDDNPYWVTLAASDSLPGAEPGDADGDGTPDATDDFPLDPDETTDSDGDGIGDGADPDDDGDGTPDASDAFPLDAAEDTDSDGDGIGDNSDPTPNGPGGGVAITCPAGTSPSVTCTRDKRGRTRFAGTGAAETFVGTRGMDVVKAGGGKDVVRAKSGKDKVNGQGGRDKLKGQGGSDRLRGAGGKDKFSGGGGNDTINSKGQRRERVNCGGGNRDKVKGAKGDRVKRNCERVRR